MDIYLEAQDCQKPQEQWQEKEKPDKQRIFWEDNLEEWTKLNFANSQLATKDQNIWRQFTIRNAKDASMTKKIVNKNNNLYQ